MLRREVDVARITDAPESLASERHRRERRYLILMALRALCLVLATILVSEKVAYAFVWGSILVIGSLILPWCAVLIANERNPRARRYRYTPPRPPAHPELTERPSEPEDHKVIDADL